MRAWLIVLGAFIWTCVLLPQAHADRRVALVVSNAKYVDEVEIQGAAKDGEVVADAFRRAGFEVTYLRNADRAAMSRALSDLRNRSTGVDIAALYFIGRAGQLDGNSFLLPTDGRLSDPRASALTSIEVGQSLSAVGGARASLVVLDGCRGQLATDVRRSVIPCLQRLEVGRGVTLLIPAAEGKAALDGAPGQNGPFATAFAEELTRPGAELRMFVAQVADQVSARTGGAQEPFVSRSLSAEVVRLGPPSGTSSSTPAAAARPGILPRSPELGVRAPLQIQLRPVLVQIGRKNARSNQNGGHAVVIMTARPEARANNEHLCAALLQTFDDAPLPDIRAGVRREPDGTVSALRAIFWPVNDALPVAGDRCPQRIARYDFVRARTIMDKHRLSGAGPFLLVSRADEVKAVALDLTGFSRGDIEKAVIFFGESFSQRNSIWEPSSAQAAQHQSMLLPRWGSQVSQAIAASLRYYSSPPPAPLALRPPCIGDLTDTLTC